jgi:flagellar biogenesis protein FliO
MMSTGFSGLDFLRMIASTLLVLTLLGGLLYLLKRMQAKLGVQTSGRQMKLVESLSLNSRHKIAMVQLDGHTVLVGVSPGQMACLAHWKNDDPGHIAFAPQSYASVQQPGAHHVP